MVLYVVKILVSLIVIVTVGELAKRETWWAALLVSLPTVSVLSMIWLYVETEDLAKVSALSWSILWLVLPSLALFVALPVLLQLGWGFWPALLAGCAITAALYTLELWLLPMMGVTW